jgi:GAF domain-containing protein
MEGTPDSAALADARATIARQSEEINRLQRQLADARFAEELREALITGATAAAIASPVTHSRLLEMIVETAADVIGAKAASLFLLDEGAQELVFEVALGQKAAEVKKFRVPVGHGIAGLVAVTGQPMAISDASKDARQATDIAEQVGYRPDSILCVPLLYRDQVIGVLELLDKEGASSFSPQDMEALFLFANQAAVAIEQSRTQTNLTGLLLDVLSTADGLSAAQRDWLGERAAAFGQSVEQETAAYRQALELARIVRQVVGRGEREGELCARVLRAFADYARPRSALEDL